MRCGFALFDTVIGRCGIAWTDLGLCGLQLPESNDLRALARLRQRFPALAEAETPAEVSRTMSTVAAFLAGDLKSDLNGLRLDFSSIGEWEKTVYVAAREIPAGSTLTYGELAARIGAPAKARAVGQALGRNPWPIVIPCHRITAANGAWGGFSAPGGAVTKRRLLEIEGALAPEALPLFARQVP